MSDLLKRIADYFANEYNGDDKTAPKMELSVDELRYIASMNVDRCRAETELRELKNKRCLFTNADRIRSLSDEELEQLINKAKFCGGLIATEHTSKECHGCKDGFCCNVKKWLQSEVEEQHGNEK